MSIATPAPPRTSDALDLIRRSASASITVKEAAAVLGVDPRTAAAALSVHGGDIPSLRVGKRIVIPRERFLAFFDGKEARVPQPAVDLTVREPDAVATVRAKLIELLGALDERPRPAA